MDQHRFTGVVRVWRTVVAAFLVVAFAAAGWAQPDRPRGHHKLDRFLAERTATASDDTPMDVIVTMRPGARRGIVKALKGSGVPVKDDITLIEAVKVRVPAKLVKLLGEDADVVSVSVDAPVRSSALSTTVTGSALNSAYSLRNTLGSPARRSPGRTCASR